MYELVQLCFCFDLVGSQNERVCSFFQQIIICNFNSAFNIYIFLVHTQKNEKKKETARDNKTSTMKLL